MSRRWWMLAAVAAAGAIAACSDDAARSVRAPMPRVVARVDPAPASLCPDGGSVVRSGLDDNGNGVLDDDEVDASAVLCNDPPVAPPPPIVVRLVAEPGGGAHCELDGTAVQTGHDRNGNGVLDDDEVEYIDYLCGEALLSRITAAPPDARCPAGGVAFQAGRDRNHDGLLGDGEVEQTDVTCGDVVPRDVAITSADDAAALANIEVIAGALTVDGTAVADLTLSRLVRVNGALRITNNAALGHIALPSLQGVGGGLVLAGNGRLAAVELAQLQRAGSLTVDGTGLTDLTGLPVLTQVDGDVEIADNAALIALAAPLREIGGGLDVHGNAQLAELALPISDAVAAVRIADNPQLRSVELPAADGFLFSPFGDVAISSNPQLARVALRATGAAAITIADNPELASVIVQAAQVRGDVVVRGNGALTLELDGDPGTGFSVGGALVVSGPVAKLGAPQGVVVTGDMTLDATELSSLPGVPFVQTAGALHVINNPALTTVAPLVLAGGLDVRDNPVLTALPALRDFGASELGGDVTIADNPVLATLGALDTVIWIR
ncbi:MAG TPA: hypothetical protein VHW23_15290, partial [Kofleriaceae bacterium]|nr:hypothetical protein [Kofleriaceae bacterium]